MRRLIACSIVAIVSWLAAPSEAMAQRGFFRWLDELSGPGPFHGGGLELPAVCYGHDEFAGREAPPRLFSVIDCWRIDSGRRKFVVGVEFALLRTGSNPLLYDPARRAQSPDVTLTWIMPTFETNLHRAVDIGVGVGVAAFGGERLDRGVYKPVVEPVRLNVKPVTAVLPDSGRGWEALSITVSLTTFPGGFRAEEFGAIPGSFEPGSELLWNVGAALDVGKLLRDR